MKVNEQLIRNCVNGERISQKALYEACAPYVYTIVKSYIVDQSFVKDGMQESFAHIFSSLHKYNKDKGTFKAWLGRITVNQCINVLKKTGKVNFSGGLELLMNIKDEEFKYLDELSKRDIEELLKSMPEGYRTVFLLNIIDGYSHEEIGKMLNITKETSRSQLSRGLQWLRKRFNNSKNFSYEAL